MPLIEVVNNRDPTCRIMKWAMELMAFGLVYTPHNTIKSQEIAYFVAEWTKALSLPPTVKIKYWMLHFDGPLIVKGVGASIILTSHRGEHFKDI